MKRTTEIGCSAAVIAVLLAAAAWVLGMGGIVRAGFAGGHWLDGLMGLLCFFWLLLLLKAPWDLYFEAHQVAFEIQRSQEKNIPVLAGRQAYIVKLRRRLGWLALGAHLLSAALVAAVAHYSGGTLGYYFAVFYLVSTVFRPTLAAYVYLHEKLRSLNREVRYPREDVEELRGKVEGQERTLHHLGRQLEACREALTQETTTREVETRELRQNLVAVSRKMETTVARLTDNQDVIDGIQVCLLSSSRMLYGQSGYFIPCIRLSAYILDSLIA